MDAYTVLDELKSLGFTVKNISTLTEIPQDRIYKWYKKTGSPKVIDYNKLLDLYNRMKPNPTNDYGFGITESMVQEHNAEYTRQYNFKFDHLQDEITQLKEDKENQKLLIKKLVEENTYLKQELKKYK